jgi:branched-chain amino acid transport system ATP-binding protein
MAKKAFNGKTVISTSCPLLRIQGLTKSFGGLKAVSDLDFEIREGEIVGLIGPNGAGKTTIFNLISGYYEPDEGQIAFLGESIIGFKPHKICARGLTRTFQLLQPFTGMTTIENTMVGAFSTTRSMGGCVRKAEGVLHLVGLDGKKDTLCENLTLPDRKCLELARALATEPRLLLLDEIMAGLMEPEWQKMLDVILGIRNNGVTVLLIEHVMKAVMRVSDRIIVINEGCKISEGNPEVVTNDQKVIAAYLGDENEFF